MNAITVTVRKDGSIYLEYYVTRGTAQMCGVHPIKPDETISSVLLRIKGMYDAYGSTINVIFEP